MEAALSSAVPHDKKLLVVSNGAFGERFEEIAQLHKMDHMVLRYEWGEVVRPQDVETLLAANPDIEGVVMNPIWKCKISGEGMLIGSHCNFHLFGHLNSSSC
jgi:aspartate aminotransferase-like enzyme